MNELQCQYCDRILKSAQGKTMHEKLCKFNPANMEEEVKEEIEVKEEVKVEEVKVEVKAEVDADGEEDTEYMAPATQMKLPKQESVDSKPKYYNRLERFTKGFKVSGNIKKEDINWLWELYKELTGKTPNGSKTCRNSVAFVGQTVALNFIRKIEPKYNKK